MSKPTKLKKKADPRKKEMLMTNIKSLVSNAACVECGKNGPLVVGIIFLILSIFLPLIPIMVSGASAYGSSFLAGLNFEADRGVYNTMTQLKEKGVTLPVSDGILSVNDPEGKIKPITDPNTSPDASTLDDIKTVILNQTETVTSQVYNFRFYLTDMNSYDLQTFVDKLDKAYYRVDTTSYIQTPLEGEKYYTPSFLIFDRKTLVMSLYKIGTTDRVSNSTGGLNWNHSSTSDLVSTILTMKGDERFLEEKWERALYNLKDTFNEAYLDTKTTTFWSTTGIYAGVYAGLIFFLGLMVFILTRGKNNPFNYISFFVAQKITWWAAFTPALLGMAVAFFIQGNVIGQMAFVILIAMRIMWLSMKQLRPAR